MTPTPTTEPHPDIQSQKMEGVMSEIPDEMFMIARHILMGHAIGTDLGKERKERLVTDMARQMTRLVQDEREICAEIIAARLPLYTDIGQINALRECMSSILSHPTSLPVSEEPVT